MSAVPALRSFRNSLTSAPLSPVSGEETGNRAWIMENKDNPAATKPAASGAGMRQLITLEEATEYGSDASQSDIVKERRTRRISKGYASYSPLSLLHSRLHDG